MPRRKPPESIDLGPYTIPVRFDFEAMKASGNNGAYMQDLSTILLQENNSEDIERDSLMHECFHAIWSQTFLDMKYDDDDHQSAGEEIILELAPRILELLRRNPDLVKYLTA